MGRKSRNKQQARQDAAAAPGVKVESASERPRSSTATSPAVEGRQTPWWAHGAFLVVLILIGSWLFDQKRMALEVDEQKYIFLSQKARFGYSQAFVESYTLRGTPLLPLIAKDVNDVPLFYHPPLVPALLSWTRSLQTSFPRLESPRQTFDPRYGVVSLLSFLGLAALLWFGWGRGQSLAARAWPVGLYLSSAIPGFIASRVWLDMPLALLTFLTLTLASRGFREGKYRDYIVAGLFLGFSLLSKFTAVLAVPLLVGFHFRHHGFKRESWIRLALATLPALVIAGPWFWAFYSTYGMLTPDWIKPSEEMIQKFPFIKIIVSRSPLYYFLILAWLAPALYFSVGQVFRRFRDRDTALLTGWVLLVFAAFIYAGLTGGGYQTRHIMPAIPALCILSGRVLARLPKPALIVAGALIAFSLYNYARNMSYPDVWKEAEVRCFLPFMENHYYFEDGIVPYERPPL